MDADVVVIGGGLAGIVCAARLSELGQRVILVDESYPDGRGRLGGFAAFSGAKFSRLPAGQGLIAVAGSRAALDKVTARTLNMLGLDSRAGAYSSDTSLESSRLGQLSLRAYESIVLTPTEIEALLARLARELDNRVQVRGGLVERLVRESNRWQVVVAGAVVATSHHIVFAGGRSSGPLLQTVGAEPQAGKGMDVGVRVEFADRRAIRSLRELGPDAKLLMGQCRTFCLNSPGTIFRYESDGISIPGGVVAEQDQAAGNFGLLFRSPHKVEIRRRVRERLDRVGRERYLSSPIVSVEAIAEKSGLLREVYGEDIASELEQFADEIGKQGLVDWSAPHAVHFPLLDWNWDIFAVSGSHRTTVESLWVIGDGAGHARGLLQAAVSGWLAADELVAR